MQQINLYQSEFYDSKDWRKLGVIGAVALLVLVFAGINIVQIYATSQLRAELENKTRTLKNLELSYSVLEKSVPPEARDMNLVAELENMKRSNSEKLRALNYLSGNDAGNQTGFSFLLQGLGRKRDTINDLWLKKISFSRGGYEMYLSGSSYQAELLPQFIQALSDEEIYKDREFRQIQIIQSEKNKRIIDFVLATQQQVEAYDASSSENRSVALFMARLKQLAGGNETVQ